MPITETYVALEVCVMDYLQFKWSRSDIFSPTDQDTLPDSNEITSPWLLYVRCGRTDALVGDDRVVVLSATHADPRLAAVAADLYPEGTIVDKYFLNDIEPLGNPCNRYSHT